MTENTAYRCTTILFYPELPNGRSEITDSTAWFITTTRYCLLLESWKSDSKATFPLKHITHLIYLLHTLCIFVHDINLLSLLDSCKKDRCCDHLWERRCKVKMQSEEEQQRTGSRQHWLDASFITSLTNVRPRLTGEHGFIQMSLGPGLHAGGWR